MGSSRDPDALTTYSSNLMLRYFKDQIVTFPNSKYVLQSWIIQAFELFYSVIIDNELTTSDLPVVQQSILFNEINAKNHAFLRDVKSKVIDVAHKNLGPDTIKNSKIPTKDELMASTKNNTGIYNKINTNNNRFIEGKWIEKGRMGKGQKKRRLLERKT